MTDQIEETQEELKETEAQEEAEANSEDTEREEAPVEPPAPVAPEVLEVEWEAVQPLVQVRAALYATEAQLSRMLLNFEKQKSKLLARSSELESTLYRLGHELRNSRGIDESVTYELKLPESEGEKAYFLKKEE